MILNGNGCFNVLMISFVWVFLSFEKTSASSARVDEYTFKYLQDYPLLNYKEAISACRDDFQRDIFFVRREGITQLLVDWLASLDEEQDLADKTGIVFH